MLPLRPSRGVDQEYQEQRFPYHGWSDCAGFLDSGDHLAVEFGPQSLQQQGEDQSCNII